MKVLIFGAGNLILTDEGFGVHCVRYLENNYDFPDSVELYDGGTLGIMVTHKFEEADRAYILDTITTEGTPGDVFRYVKDDFMLKRVPIKMSPHQIGIQEMLLISEMRGACPAELILYGVIPASLDAGMELSPVLAEKLPLVADMLVRELQEAGIAVQRKAATAA